MYIITLILCVLIGCCVRGSDGAAQTQAWLFDAVQGDPVCGAPDVYKNNQIDVLKPIFISIDGDGNLSFDNSTTLCNGGSNAFIAEMKQYSTYQYATVGSTDNGATAVNGLVSNPSKSAAAINSLVDFATNSGFTGIEIDFEGFENWSSELYTQYISFLTDLGNRLHNAGKLLMIDVPAIYSADQQNFYKNFTYEGLNGTPVDYIAIMAYDGYFDGTCGTPVASNAFTNGTIQWAFSKITNHSQIIMGIPAYGYHCATGTTNFPAGVDTLSQSQNFPGFSTAQIDPNSYELIWTNGGNSYVAINQAGLDRKRALIESWGIESIAVWYIGGNAWFSSNSSSTTTTTTTATSSSPTATTASSSSTTTTTSQGSTSSSTTSSSSASSTLVCSFGFLLSFLIPFWFL